MVKRTEHSRNAKRLLLGVVLIVFHVFSFPTLPAPAAAPKKDGMNRQLDSAAEQSSCGARAAFLFGRLCGLNWKYAEAKQLFPSLEGGTSFKTVQSVLESQAIACELRRMNPTELPRTRLPVIVFLRPQYTGSNLGHFMVLTNADADGVRLIDPITGAASLRGWRAFSNGWSGHCLVRTGEMLALGSGLMAMLLLHAGALVCYLFWTRAQV